MPSEWQIHVVHLTHWKSLDALQNLYLNANFQNPAAVPPQTALVRMGAAALNTRNVIVMSHGPIYPGNRVEDLVPCVDGGERL